MRDWLLVIVECRASFPHDVKFDGVCGHVTTATAQEIKSSLKFTKMNEMQVQIKTYLSESRRLQKYIEFSEAKRRQESNSVYNAANWKMLHGRLQSLMKENEIMSTQLGNAVEVFVGCFVHPVPPPPLLLLRVMWLVLQSIEGLRVELPLAGPSLSVCLNVCVYGIDSDGRGIDDHKSIVPDRVDHGTAPAGTGRGTEPITATQTD